MTILDQILVETRKTIERDRQRQPIEELRAAAKDLPPCKDFHGALAKGDQVNLIAEVKRASPSAGLIREDFDHVAIAQAYQRGGASCLSVLTDEPFFQGSLDFLRDVTKHVELPVLRKDFIIDEYQILQARVAGASCVLLIAECLSANQLKECHDYAVEHGMQTLIELYEPENLQGVLATGTNLVGVNNRNLHTFQTDLDHTLRLRPQIPSDRLLVGESGIRTHDDVLHLGRGGVKAILVGESLMRQDDIESAVRSLLNR